MLKILNKPYECNIPKDYPITFNFPLDSFQLHSFDAIYNDEHVLVTAHTGSGKTVVAIFAVANYISKGKKVVYTSPIKTLSNQKYNEFRELFEIKYSEEQGKQFTVGLMTGDNKINPDADCVIMTTEILRNALYDIGKDESKKKDQYFKDDFISSIGCVIFDEVHYINDPDRGHVWEEVITLLDPSVTLVMLSATIDKANEFAQWIADIKDKPVNLIPTTKRIVPLEHYIYLDDQLYKILDKDNKFYESATDTAYTKYKIMEKEHSGLNKTYMINKMVTYLKDHDMLQTIFFSFSRTNCEKYAKTITTNLLTPEEVSKVSNLFDKYMRKYEDCYNSLKQFYIIKDLACKGISFHHSGLIPILKEVVEIMFQHGLIKVLFATETFAVGVNMPTRTIVFTELEKYTEMGRRMLQPAEYKQMSGRAGRRGIDKFGYVIILPLYDMHTKQELKSLMLGKPPHIESKFNIDYSFILKIIQSNSKNITQFLDASLFNRDTVSKVDHDIRVLEKLKLEQSNLDISSKYDKNICDKLNKYIQFTDMEEKYKNMGISLGKKEMNEKKKMLTDLNKNKTLNAIYKQYKTDIDKTKQISTLEHTITSVQNFSQIESSKIISLLIHFNYVKNIDKPFIEYNSDDITIKGIIAGQINECNPLIFTEMIINNMFDDLDHIEIVSLLSIFIEDVKPDSRLTLNSVKCSGKLLNKLQLINGICNNYIKMEQELGIDLHHNGFWDIYYDYLQPVYVWITTGSISNVLELIDTYEGNFIKSMLKLNNIVQDLISLSHIHGNVSIIPKLEIIEDCIIKGIVTVNSLYL